MTTRHKLDKLTIRGFQSIQTLEDFPLHDLNVMIGPNGAGKSNLVNYFRMLGELVEQRLQVWVQKRGGADRLLTFGVKKTAQLFSRLQFGDSTYSFTLAPTDNGGFVFAEEHLFYREEPPDSYFTIAGHKEAELKDEALYGKDARFCYNTISSWRVFHFHDTSDTAGVKRWVAVEDAAYLRGDASNLAAYLYRLRQAETATYEQIRQTVQLALPFFEDFVLEPRTLNGPDQQVHLLWRQKGSDYPMWPTQLSDGALRFICLTTALLQPDPPATIIIDEPELGLHPCAITLLGALVRSASKRMQIILSTQSVPLLNELSLEDLIIVEREAGVSTFKRLNETEFEHCLEDYTAGELWEKNLLGGRP